VKTAVGSEMSLVSGTYHENFGSVVMEMASFCLKIRHVFGFTSLTERSIGAGPPVIIQLSGYNGWNVQISAILLLKIAQNGRNLNVPSVITLDRIKIIQLYIRF
jgi:hypothetical protein